MHADPAQKSRWAAKFERLIALLPARFASTRQQSASPSKKHLPPWPGGLRSKPFSYSEFINGIRTRVDYGQK